MLVFFCRNIFKKSVFWSFHFCTMKFIVCLGFVLFIFSCGKPQENSINTVQPSEYSLTQKHTKPVEISKNAKKKVERWKEYQELSEFIQKFNAISPNDALTNARGLNVLVKSLNDSIKPIFIESPAFSARVNLLFNEVLRLYDMSTISSIKVEEVNIQVQKILDAYASMNAKINTVVQQETLDREVENSKFDKVINSKGNEIIKPDKSS